MAGRRIRRLVRAFFRLLVALIVLVAAGIGYLRITNPKPQRSDGWARLADMPNVRGETASANVGARFVVAGGLRGIAQVSDAVGVYEIEKDRWTTGKPLPSPRHHAAAAAVDGWVYVTGGSRSINFTPTATVWRSNPGERWATVARMPEPRQGHTMVALGKKLYVLGGVGPTDRTLVYDTRTKSWTTRAPLPSGRNHLRAVTWGKQIWVIGGRDPNPIRRVDIYDPRRDRWRLGPRLPEAMSAMAVGVLEGSLHVVGGEDPSAFGGRVIDGHFVLRRSSQRWTAGSRPLLPVHGAGYAVHGDRLIIAGGASRQGAFSILSWTGLTQIFAP